MSERLRFRYYPTALHPLDRMPEVVAHFRCERTFTTWATERVEEQDAFWDEVLTWCADQFGEPHDHIWSAFRSITAFTIDFYDEVSATAFRIRWG